MATDSTYFPPTLNIPTNAKRKKKNNFTVRYTCGAFGVCTDELGRRVDKFGNPLLPSEVKDQDRELENYALGTLGSNKPNDTRAITILEALGVMPSSLATVFRTAAQLNPKERR